MNLINQRRFIHGRSRFSEEGQNLSRPRPWASRSLVPHPSDLKYIRHMSALHASKEKVRPRSSTETRAVQKPCAVTSPRVGYHSTSSGSAVKSSLMSSTHRGTARIRIRLKNREREKNKVRRSRGSNARKHCTSKDFTEVKKDEQVAASLRSRFRSEMRLCVMPRWSQEALRIKQTSS